jgi:hypothetical protein
LTGIKLFILAVLLNGCSEFALLSSGGSLAISNNTYAKAYSSIDFATTLTTEKDIKTHAYHYVKKVKEIKELVINNNNKIETVKTIPVEESILYPPDANLLLASVWTYKEDKKINNNRIQLYLVNQTGYELKW